MAKKAESKAPRKEVFHKDPLTFLTSLFAVLVAVSLRYVLLPAGLLGVLVWVGFIALFCAAAWFGQDKLVPFLVALWVLEVTVMPIGWVNLLGAAVTLVVGTVVFGLDQALRSYPKAARLLEKRRFENAERDIARAWNLLADPSMGIPLSVMESVTTMEGRRVFRGRWLGAERHDFGRMRTTVSKRLGVGESAVEISSDPDDNSRFVISVGDPDEAIPKVSWDIDR